MTSKQMEEDFELLMNMEIKMHMLDAEGINIPKNPPIIPPEPSNYDFYYQD